MPGAGERVSHQPVADQVVDARLISSPRNACTGSSNWMAKKSAAAVTRWSRSSARPASHTTRDGIRHTRDHPAVASTKPTGSSPATTCNRTAPPTTARPPWGSSRTIASRCARGHACRR